MNLVNRFTEAETEKKNETFLLIKARVQWECPKKAQFLMFAYLS